ncbi:MAG: hypothetical protein A3E84_03190 [Gammaproteobacteria bacterium RIFCSPHIGHO2_12_FULL_42_13]|nr:MAG: hypothetical protein A3E84_03190 [Gammaproteobacteria bacterium RIFCSPHIGHO2_12_FULL_42_13]
MIISFGQALLLLMDHHRGDKELLAKIKRLYLLGIPNQPADSDVSRQFMRALLNDDVLQDYQISVDPDVISEDSSRRLFETHLAFETLKAVITRLNRVDVVSHYTALYAMLPISSQAAFNGYFTGSAPAGVATEFADAVSQLHVNPHFKIFSPTDLNKMELLLRIGLLGVIIARIFDLPLDIYGRGFFSLAARGRTVKEPPTVAVGRLTTLSRGLMKSYMPTFYGDITHRDSGFSYLKPADAYQFKRGTAWPEYHFSSLIHPFSGSISGTMLILLRACKHLANQENLLFNTREKMGNFLVCFSSLLLCHSGGHSFFEFLAPLEIPEVRCAFSFIPGFEQLNLATLLMDGNEQAVDTALEKAIEYNTHILKLRAVHEDIKNLTTALKKP